MTPMTPTATGRPCPYVGLQPFLETDRDYFFGRDRDQRIITANLLSSSLTILYGASGVGKSSLLMAGVVPHLARAHPRTPVVVFRDWAGADFQEALARACIAAVWKEDSVAPRPAANLPLDEVLRACAQAAHDSILVIFDQFEEFFLYHPKSWDPESFEAQFARTVNRDDVDVGFLIALREDSLSKLDRFRERIANLLSNRLILNHLDEEGAAVALRRPLAVWSEKYAAGEPPVTIADDLVTELINQVRIGRITVGQPLGSGGARAPEHFIEAPFLQLVASRLWAEETGAGSRVLRLATLERLGGAQEIVHKHLDDVMEGLDAPSRDVCASFFDRLVTPTGSKVACSQDDLERWAESLAPQVARVLEHLCTNRILRRVAQSSEDPNATSFEIYHDVLAAAVLAWRARYIGTRQQAELERKANEAEARAREKEQTNRQLLRWRRGLSWALGVTVIAATLSVVTTFWAVDQQRKATAGERRAMSFAAIGSSYSSRDKPELSALLALQALYFAQAGKFQDVLPRAENALRRALNQPLRWSQVEGDKVGAVAYSPDGARVATASGTVVQVRDARTGAQAPTPKALQHPSTVRAVAFTADGARLVSGDAKGVVRIWDAQTGEERPAAAPIAHGAPLSAMALGPGDLLVTGSLKDGVVVFWDLVTGARIGELPFREGARRWVSDLAFSPDGSRLAVGEVSRGAPEIWDLSQLRTGGARFVGTLVQGRTDANANPDPEKKMLVDALAYSPDGRWLATGDRDNTVNLWDARTGAHLKTFWGHTDPVRRLAFSPDATRLVSASGDNTVRLWETETARPLLTLAGHTKPVQDLAFSPDGKGLVTGGGDGQIRAWNVATHAGPVNAVAFNVDGSLLATGSSDNSVKVWSVPGRELIADLGGSAGHQKQVRQLAFSPDGKRLASAGFDKTIRVWDLTTRAPALSAPLRYDDAEFHHDKFYDVAYSHDSKWLAAAGANYNAVVWDAVSGDLLFAGRHGNAVEAVAFSPDDRYLASGGLDGRVNIWGIPSGALMACFSNPAPDDPKFLDVELSPDGRRLLMLTGNREILVADWQPERVGAAPGAPAGADACMPAAKLPGLGRQTGADQVQFTPDGKRILTIDADGSLRFWDAATGEEVNSLTPPHRGKVNHVAVSPDGYWLATAGEDWTFHVSPVNSDQLFALGCTRVSRTLTKKECRTILGKDQCPADPCADQAAPAHGAQAPHAPSVILPRSEP